jgi:hypothetical protein
MVEMALVACLFSACVNYIRDGKNPEDELVGKNGQMKHEKTARYRFNKDISLGSLQRFGMVEGSTMAFQVLLLAFSLRA